MLSDGPDFICIGMAKAGTSWLYEQLSGHPDFWMPRVKELQYLNHRVPRLPNVEKHLRQLERRADRRKPMRPGKRGNDARQRAFLTDAKALIGEPMDIARYAALFRHKEQRLSGDISPPYASLSDEVVSAIAERLPDLKVVLLVREPLERAWSSISMNHRRGRFDAGLLEDAKAFRLHFQEHRSDDRLFPTRIVERWAKCAPKLPFRYFFFDDISADAQKVRRDVLQFLGADPEKESGELPADYNRKANAPKLPLSDSIKAVLLDHFGKEIKACGEILGGSAKNWASRYGI